MAVRLNRARERADERARDDLPEIHVMTPEEGVAFFDRKARTTLGISGAEFLERWDRGEYRPVPDTREGREIARLVMLIPFARRANP